MTQLSLTLQTQQPAIDEAGNRTWRTTEQVQSLSADRVAIILCDVWNSHYCTAAVDRLEPMVPRMNQLLHTARDAGSVIIHAPSETMDFYEGALARQRALAVKPYDLPQEIEHDNPAMPIDGTPETSCDRPDCLMVKTFDRQHRGIDIDDDRDYLCDDGPTCYAITRHHHIERVVLLGVHTNMCILHRTFGIKQMTGWGVNMTLVRDLTDSMYNPMTWPYVSHDAGTQLVIDYIEKFWCPTIHSDNLISI